MKSFATKNDFLRRVGPVLIIWAVSRMYVVFGILLGRKVGFLPTGQEGRFPLESRWWESILRWDAGWYISIVTNGYSYAPDGNQHSIAFFPLYPLLVKFLTFFFGPHVAPLGLIVSNMFFLAAILLLFRYTEKYHPDVDPQFVVFLAAFHPFGFFYSSMYTESLFLCLAIFAFLMFKEQRFSMSALGLSLLCITRLPGVFVAATLGLAYLFSQVLICEKGRLHLNCKRLVSFVVWSGISASGLLAFILYQYFRFGQWNAFIRAHEAWQRHIGDYHGLLGQFDWELYSLMNSLPALLILGTSIALSLVKGYRVYAPWGFLLVFVPALTGNLTSMQRYSTVFFPMVILLGRLCRDMPVAKYVLLIISSSGLLIFTSLFVRFYFVG
jgi:hypothetical protein